MGQGGVLKLITLNYGNKRREGGRRYDDLLKCQQKYKLIENRERKEGEEWQEGCIP